ncbi:hypothetical protein LJR231_005911 [Phyllobacterium sp. LjRoot231]|uniref:hypothetical protein n=1 Tax=Phyllobacterium sp. LjRoot231 TaxID=3342289 RepID=UPI003ECD91B0
MTERYDYNLDRNRITSDMVGYEELNKAPRKNTDGMVVSGVVAVVLLLAINWLSIRFPGLFAWLGSL